MKYTKIREEELKNRVGADFFEKFNCTRIVGSIDFAVKFKRSNNALDFNDEYLLWAEAKVKPDGIPEMLTQLVLTIGKARTFDKIPPPPFLGCFDNAKIAFVRYANFHDIFNLSDLNWKVPPSDRETKEFKKVEAYINKIIDNDTSHEIYIFDFEKDEKELIQFIRENFVLGKTETTKISINKNNFISIYNKWLEAVKPSIRVDWEFVKKDGIIDGDFYLADLLSDENKTLKDKLYVLLKYNEYEVNKGIGRSGMLEFMRTDFKDKQKAHTQFWAKYKRPPLEEYWDYIVNRRDLLVPQDVRERKGSFFTPKIWVELSQKYIADVLGEDWQDEYYVWDCAAGTGNLLAGLTNKYNIWASTLDKADVDVMKDRIKNGANLLEDHVFQFDFLNDSFNKLPKGLLDIINDEEKRKKLVIYINPPYAEADNRKGEGRAGVAESAIHIKYSNLMGYTKRELYIQFLTRIYCEIPNGIIADFSKLKNLQAPRFQVFRQFFRASLKKIFLVPANTFDNVVGDFPIGFQIWDTGIKEDFEYISADVYDENKKFIGNKTLCTYDNVKLINNWVKTYRTSNSKSIATIIGVGSDFQNQRLVRFGEPHMKVPADNHNWQITKDNL
ncbi:MAG: hypothetical protein FWC23_08360, partial [Chitinispirillia bacterium]|nr:hypothetical protein [Chitinispirillia bacterium]MCL2269181.1 hypothetical protein [Chitinispirillia bacterium]